MNKLKKESKKSKKEKLIEFMFKGKIQKLVVNHRVTCICEVFNYLNEHYYSEFGVNASVEILDFFDRSKNTLINKNIFNDSEKESDNEKA